MTWSLFCGLWCTIGLTERIKPLLADQNVAMMFAGLEWRIVRLEAENASRFPWIW